MKKIILLLFTSISLFNCSNDDSDAPNPNTVQLATNDNLGSILTDVEGMSLYILSKDIKGTSECTGGCIDAWPIFYTEKITLDAGLDNSDFGVITRPDGTKQTTYKGWPLYYFANDVVPGDTKGDKVGNRFFVAKPDYSLMYAQTQIEGENNLTFYMTDALGRTLYAFFKDTFNDNNFTKEDFSNNALFPIFHTEIDKLPSILNKDDFKTIDVFGRKQLTYKGNPLYYSDKDLKKGDILGRSTAWPLVNTDTPIGDELGKQALKNK
jgi:predicted lipoprotein with Yx(FWY)xxD motif